MAISTSNGPREGSFATSKLLPLNSRLNFSNLLMAYFFSYFKSSSTTSTSKVSIDVTPMVVIVVGDFMKCKLWATLWNSPCNLPWLPPCACIVSFFVSSFWNFKILVYFCSTIICATCPWKSQSNRSSWRYNPSWGPLLFFWLIFQLERCYFKTSCSKYNIPPLWMISIGKIYLLVFHGSFHFDIRNGKARDYHPRW